MSLFKSILIFYCYNPTPVYFYKVKVLGVLLIGFLDHIKIRTILRF